MSIPAWLIIADDLTGACDSGAAFAKRGYSTRVAFQAGSDLLEAAVQVLVTESRALPVEQAVQAVSMAARLLVGHNNSRVYQKIDSTLRGHPGLEFSTLLSNTGDDRALVCPAFPEQGRVVRQGQVLVHGVPLESTPFAGDASVGELARLFDSGPGSQAIYLADVRRGVDWLAQRFAQPGIFTADAESTADLELLARAGQQAGIRLYCGSAGLARALAAQIAPGSAPSEISRVSGPLLVVAGSRSQATLEQVAALACQGWELVYPAEADLDIQDIPTAIALRIAKKINEGIPVAVGVERLAPVAGGERRVAEWLAGLAADVVRRAPVGGLILTGGATARAVLLALDCAAIELRGEVEPGVVGGLLRGGAWDGLPLVTKAGGFGGPDALIRSANFLEK